MKLIEDTLAAMPAPKGVDTAKQTPPLSVLPPEDVRKWLLVLRRIRALPATYDKDEAMQHWDLCKALVDNLNLPEDN